MTTNDDAEQLDRIKHRADKLGYRLVPKAESNLWQLIIRLPENFLVTSIIARHRTSLDESPEVVQIVDGPRRL